MKRKALLGVLAAGRIAAKLHDGHTNLLNNSGDAKQITDSKILRDGRPDAINGIPTEKIYQTFLTQCSYELEVFAAYLFDHAVLNNDRMLTYCGVDTEKGVTYTYQDEEKQVQFGEPKEYETQKPEYTIDTKKGLAVLTVHECNYDEKYCDMLQEFFDEVDQKRIQNIILDLRDNGGGSSQEIYQMRMAMCWDFRCRIQN